MSKKRITCLIAAISAVAALIGGLVYLNSVRLYREAVKNLTFSSIQLDSIADGVYTGECDVGFISAQVRVTVAHSKIEAVELLEHKNDRGAAAEVVTERIVEAQSLNVDAVSGATNSVKVIIKATENALSSGIIK